MNSCLKTGYFYEDRKNYQMQENYLNNTLILKDYILFGTYRRKKLDYGISPSNNDSLFNIFKNSIKNIGITISIDTINRNLSNRKIIERYHSRAKHIDKVKIKEYVTMPSTDESIRVLIPVIKFNHHTDYHQGDAGTIKYYVTHLSLAIFIIENNEAIYYKKMRYTKKVESEFHSSRFFNYFQVPIPQENWDNLLKKVMKDFLERLK